MFCKIVKVIGHNLTFLIFNILYSEKNVMTKYEPIINALNLEAYALL